MCKVIVVSAEITPRLKLNLVAREKISSGEVVLQCHPQEIQRQRTWRTVQIDYNQHIRNEFLDYIDHSCEPNTIFDSERLSFIAIRDIAKGHSLTFFYPGSEVELAQDFNCQCGIRSCLGHIKGGFYLTRNQMQWAIEQGYCTLFMRTQLLRILDRGSGQLDTSRVTINKSASDYG